MLLLKLLRLRVRWIALITVLGAAAIIITFAAGLDLTPFGYVSYLLSAYALTVLTVNFPFLIRRTPSIIRKSKLFRKTMTFLLGHEHSKRYVTDIAYRVRISLIASVIASLLYAALKLFAGLHYASFWYGADALFYFVLSAVRILLTRNMRGNERDMAKEYRLYRSCGVLIFALNVALIGVVYQVINQNMGYRYRGLLVFVVATYAFIKISVAITSVIRFRKRNSPILSAVKVINFAKALVAIFALQSAMFASFGSNDSEALKQLMNIIVGGCVCATVFAMAVYMVVNANEKLKKLGADNTVIRDTEHFV